MQGAGQGGTSSVGWFKMPAQQPVPVLSQQHSLPPRAVLRFLPPNSYQALSHETAQRVGNAGWISSATDAFAPPAPPLDSAVPNIESQKQSKNCTRLSPDFLLDYPNIKRCSPEEAVALSEASQRIYVLPPISTERVCHAMSEEIPPRVAASSAEQTSAQTLLKAKVGEWERRRPQPQRESMVNNSDFFAPSPWKRFEETRESMSSSFSPGQLGTDASRFCHPSVAQHLDEQVPPGWNSAQLESDSRGAVCPQAFASDTIPLPACLETQGDMPQQSQCEEEEKTGGVSDKRDASLQTQELATISSENAAQTGTLESLQALVARQHAEQNQLFDQVYSQMLDFTETQHDFTPRRDETEPPIPEDLAAQLEDVERQLEEKERQIQMIEQTVEKGGQRESSEMLWGKCFEGGASSVFQQGASESLLFQRVSLTEASCTQAALEEQQHDLLKKCRLKEEKLLRQQRLLEEAFESLRRQKERHEAELSALQRNIILQRKKLQDEKEKQRLEREMTVQTLERYKEDALQRLTEERTRIEILKQKMEDALSDQRLQLLHHHQELQLQLREQRQLQEEVLEKQRQDLKRAQAALENQELQQLLLAFQDVRREVYAAIPPVDKLLRVESLPPLVDESARESSSAECTFRDPSEERFSCSVEDKEKERLASSSSFLQKGALSVSSANSSCSGSLQEVGPVLSRLPLSRLGSPDRRRVWRTQLREQKNTPRSEAEVINGRLCGCAAYGASHPPRRCRKNVSQEGDSLRNRPSLASLTSRLASNTDADLQQRERSAASSETFLHESLKGEEVRPRRGGESGQFQKDGLVEAVSRLRPSGSSSVETPSLALRLRRLTRPTVSQKQREKQLVAKTSFTRAPPPPSLPPPQPSQGGTRGGMSLRRRNVKAKSERGGHDVSERRDRAGDALACEAASSGREPPLWSPPTNSQRVVEEPSSNHLLSKLADEQRRRIQLLLLEKEQLERDVRLGVSEAPPSERRFLERGTRHAECGDLTKRTLLPHEPYVPPEANCLVVSGAEGCACGGEHPKTVWDEVDVALAKIHNSHCGRLKWRKVNEGVYFYGDTQVSLAFINGRLKARADPGPDAWNRGAHGDVIKFIDACDVKYAATTDTACMR